MLPSLLIPFNKQAGASQQPLAKRIVITSFCDVSLFRFLMMLHYRHNIHHSLASLQLLDKLLNNHYHHNMLLIASQYLCKI